VRSVSETLVPRDQPLPPSHARTSLSLLADQTHVNLLGNVHGGEVMRLVDSTAGAVAQRHSGGPAVTAAMDEMAFLQPVHVGDIVRTMAQVNWAGRTSMEIGVRVEAEDIRTGAVRHTNSCYFTMVAVDDAGRPADVPRLVPETAADHRRHAAAGVRRGLRREIADRLEQAKAGAA
jgi:uncharacterized protein (TIGR00369 family)